MSTEEQLSMNFYGVSVVIKSNSKNLIDLLSKDFEFFLQPSLSTANYVFDCRLVEVPWEKLPTGLNAKKQSVNSITYDKGPVRYNDYYGSALSIYDYGTDSCQVFTPSLSKLHELSYLIILSRTGKKMDEAGLHKIHASGLHYQGTNFIFMMPMKGGKSTLFNALLNNPKIEILSDDTPIVSGTGRTYPFPLRMGLEHLPENPSFATDRVYSLERGQYGIKNLVPMSAFKNKVHGPNTEDKCVLVQGVRSSGKTCQLVKAEKIHMIRPMAMNMVVGVGLPMILEYFLQGGMRDHIKNFHILRKRMKAAWSLVMRSECYVCYLGGDIKENTRAMKELVESNGHTL